MVSYGLLTEIDVAGRAPGELVAPRGDARRADPREGPRLDSRRARRALRQRRAGPRGSHPRRHGRPASSGRRRGGCRRRPTTCTSWRWRRGPGVAAPYWPTAKPYQPTSPDFTPYVLGMSGAVFVDADGSGTFESALAYARRELAATADPRRLAARLGRYDAAVATQAASLLRARDPAGFEATVGAMLAARPAARSRAGCGPTWKRGGRPADPRRRVSIGAMTRSVTIGAVVLALAIGGALADAPGAAAGAGPAQHHPDPGRRPRLRRPERLRPGAVPDAGPRSPGPRGHPLHALLRRQHGLRPVAGRADDRACTPATRGSAATARSRCATRTSRSRCCCATPAIAPPSSASGASARRARPASRTRRASTTPSGSSTIATRTGSTPTTCIATPSGSRPTWRATT